jgi:hypothetical protein
MKFSSIAGTLFTLSVLSGTAIGNEGYVLKFSPDGSPLDIITIDLRQADFASNIEVSVDGSIWLSRIHGSGGPDDALVKYDPLGNELMVLRIPALPQQPQDFLRPTGFDFDSNGNIYVGAIDIGVGIPTNQLTDQIYVFNAAGVVVDSFGGVGDGRASVEDVKLTADDRLMAIIGNPGAVYETALDGTIVNDGFDPFDDELRLGWDLAITEDVVWAYLPRNGGFPPHDDHVVGYTFAGQVAHSIDVGFITNVPGFGIAGVVSIVGSPTGNVLVLDRFGTLHEITPSGNIIEQTRLSTLVTFNTSSVEDFTIDRAGNIYLVARSLVPEPATSTMLVSFGFAAILLCDWQVRYCGCVAERRRTKEGQ